MRSSRDVAEPASPGLGLPQGLARQWIEARSDEYFGTLLSRSALPHQVCGILGHNESLCRQAWFPYFHQPARTRVGSLNPSKGPSKVQHGDFDCRVSGRTGGCSAHPLHGGNHQCIGPGAVRPLVLIATLLHRTGDSQCCVTLPSAWRRSVIVVLNRSNKRPHPSSRPPAAVDPVASTRPSADLTCLCLCWFRDLLGNATRCEAQYHRPPSTKN